MNPTPADSIRLIWHVVDAFSRMPRDHSWPAPVNMLVRERCEQCAGTGGYSGVVHACAFCAGRGYVIVERSVDFNGHVIKEQSMNTNDPLVVRMLAEFSAELSKVACQRDALAAALREIVGWLNENADDDYDIGPTAAGHARDALAAIDQSRTCINQLGESFKEKT